MMIKITKAANKGLNKLPKKIKAKFITAFKAIARDDLESLDIKKMQGGENAFRLRIGQYRAIYEVVDDMIILRVGPRGNIYK